MTLSFVGLVGRAEKNTTHDKANRITTLTDSRRRLFVIKPLNDMRRVAVMICLRLKFHKAVSS